jgi:ketosteroid isomerase-like protein
VKRAFAAVALVAAALFAEAESSHTPTDTDSVLRSITRACDAFRDGDVTYLQSFLAEDFTLTDSSGVVTTREQNLEEVRRREPRYDVFSNHDMKVRLYGDAAVVNGITTVKGSSHGEPFAADFQFTDTLVRRSGRWIMVASHATRRASAK